MIATLDISKAVDEFGNVVEPKVDFENPIFRLVGGPSLLTVNLLMKSAHRDRTLFFCLPAGYQIPSSATSDLGLNRL